MIFNLGAVIGGLIPLGQNINVRTNSTVTDGTYIAFIVLTVIGAGLAWALVNAKDVVRKDGSRVILMKHPSWKTEIFGLFETFKTDPYIVFLFPMFFSSNWFYTYHFNDGMSLSVSVCMRIIANCLRQSTWPSSTPALVPSTTSSIISCRL